MKKKINNALQEKIFIVTSLGLTLLGLIACGFNLYTNYRFVIDFLTIVYYLSYGLLLVGGLAIGWFSAQKKESRLLSASVYALIAVPLYSILDLLRLPLNNVDIGYPWGAILFEGMPLITLLVLALAAILANKKGIKDTPKIALIVLFVIGQLYTLWILTEAFFHINGSSFSGPTTEVLLYLVVQPFVFAIISYFVLVNISPRRERVFYASSVGTVAVILSILLWNFSTDPTLEATNAFSMFATFTILGVVIILTALLRLPSSIKPKVR